MAKTYINTVKYLVKISVEIDGIVDKPDIIGAIFGQSEGLLGDEMDLKELQKNGKLGRIEINFTTSMGRTKGEILVPSSMDMAETSLLAAGIESVDKVGPCEAKLKVLGIEDTRNDKRKEIKDRARELLKSLMDKNSPETQSLTDEIRENARAADIVEYGMEKLPAGPDIDISDEIIVVEGRADVINLLKNQIRNVIGMNGSNIPQTIVELSKTKEIIAFVDGDRGGELNARKLTSIAKIKFVAKAPDGKEVEELTRKEILQSLKKRGTPEEELAHAGHTPPQHGFGEQRYPERNFSGGRGEFRPQRFEQRGFAPRQRWGAQEGAAFHGGQNFNRGRRDDRTGFPSEGFGRGTRDRRPRRDDRPQSGFRGGMDRRTDGFQRSDPMSQHTADAPSQVHEFEYPADAGSAPTKPRIETGALSAAELDSFKPMLEGLRGTMKAKILDESNNVLKETKVKDVVAEVAKAKKASAVVFDGVVTKRLLEAAEKAGIKHIIGARKGKVQSSISVKVAIL